jgi:DNA (cytosine-5)-methyltransferase 1
MERRNVRAFRDVRGGFGKELDITDIPCPAVLAGTVGNLWIEDDGKPMQTATDKPPYSVPTMDEVRGIPWNGLSVASTFSGCGGSSTGYRMAGFKVLWASEFIEAARESYAANMGPDTILDGRDIRTVDPQSILDAINMEPGELDLLDGSPPCASFSTAGKREAGWGKVKKYSDGTQRTDDLFFEFSRLLRGIKPRTFVAENVSGLVKGTAKGYFLEILADLKAAGYVVKCKVLDAQWLGVPQMRQRTIFVGVRNDIDLPPAHPKPLPYRYSVRDALPQILATIEPEADISQYAIGAEYDKLKQGESSEKYFNLVKTDAKKPSGSVTAYGARAGLATVCHPTEKRKFTIAELKRICAFPDDFILTGTYAQQWERLGRAVPPVMMSHISAAIRDGVLT